jgi:hypothetical protein
MVWLVDDHSLVSIERQCEGLAIGNFGQSFLARMGLFRWLTPFRCLLVAS